MTKGIVLAGGRGTRLLPMTDPNHGRNKHILTVYDQPMIDYPLKTLARAGIKEVMIVLGGDNVEGIVGFIKDGSQYGFTRVEYTYQVGNGGISTALYCARHFAGSDPIAVILGDNCTDADIYFNPDNNADRARIFLLQVTNPHRFGVAEFREDFLPDESATARIIGIQEKPINPPSSYAVTGLYFYPNDVFKFIANLQPSSRGETEITDVNNWYIKNGRLDFSILDGFWSDAGTPESLLEVGRYWQKKNEK